MKWLYPIILWLALPLVWLRLRWRARSEPAYRERQAERFGRVPDQIRDKCIWFHTVSAGETIAAASAIAQVVAAQEHPVLVTTMTPTGSEQVRERLGDQVDHCYAPYDFGFAIERFFERVQPRLLVLMETELWPNMIAAAAARNIPVLVVNARLSQRSADGYARLGSLSRTMLGRLSGVLAQTEDHARRFVALGVDPERVAVNGNVKYDARLPETHDATVAALRARLAWEGYPVLIAASTHPGEDEPIISAYDELAAAQPNLRLVLVPRHPVRADAVCQLVADAGMSFVRQSSSDWDEAAPQVLIGDVMGALQTLYGLADVAFVGGSLVERGGHNPIEPALCGIPVVCGPYVFNFQDVVEDLAQAGGLVVAQGEAELLPILRELLGDPQRCRAAGTAALAFVDANRGAEARLSARLLSESGRLPA
ncbi:MAG: lipid IV(A) 3-deoxy-D-manno-octulosonic acid transferase [Pseudomonadota bacterium]